jgi:hypothetical protein
MKKFLIVILVFFVFQSGCGAKKMATNVVGKISTDGMVSVEDETDLSFARESAPALIKVLEVLSYGNPKDRGTLILLSRAYGQYAFGFLEQELLSISRGSADYGATRQRTNLFYARGKDYGLKALETLGPLKGKINAPFPEFKKALSRLGKKSVPALFWTAFSWAGWLNLNSDDPSAIIALPKIEAIVGRILELDGNYYFGSAHALLGVLSASRPAMFGGNEELARQEFTKAFEISPNYLMTKVLFAQYYCRRINDPSLFEETLGSVLSANVSPPLGAGLANNLAIERARTLIFKKKELF